MGLIGHFIDRACERRPDVMRGVFYRPFGTLEEVIDRDEGGMLRGCLVGTMAIVAGRAYGDDPVRVAGELVGVDRDIAADVGFAAWNIVCRDLLHDVSREDAEDFAVTLIKNRIDRRLSLRARAS